VIYAHAIDSGKHQLAWVSDSVKSLLGHDADACLAAGWWADRVHPDDRADVLARWSGSWSDDRLVCEYRFRTHDGRYRWLRDEVRLVRDLAGEPIDCVGSWSDLTERKQAEDTLRRTQTQYRDVVEASVQGIAILQADRFCYVNPAGARMFGYRSPMEMVGEPWQTVVAPEEVANLRARIAACTAGATADHHPGWQGLRKGGTRFWLESLASPIAWNGQPAVLSLLRDITQQRHLEEQYRQAQKMEAVGRLAGGVAHDFNNLLTVIIGYSDMVRMGLPSADPLRNLVEQVLHARERAALLTRPIWARCSRA
jgi:two-component system cell cycle sensor histidine kinase/response regulator CckA